MRKMENYFGSSAVERQQPNQDTIVQNQAKLGLISILKRCVTFQRGGRKQWILLNNFELHVNQDASLI